MGTISTLYELPQSPIKRRYGKIQDPGSHAQVLTLWSRSSVDNSGLVGLTTSCITPGPSLKPPALYPLASMILILTSFTSSNPPPSTSSWSLTRLKVVTRSAQSGASLSLLTRSGRNVASRSGLGDAAATSWQLHRTHASRTSDLLQRGVAIDSTIHLIHHCGKSPRMFVTLTSQPDPSRAPHVIPCWPPHAT